jgi:hypothetical protein
MWLKKYASEVHYFTVMALFILSMAGRWEGLSWDRFE